MSRSSSVRGCMSFHAGRSTKATTPTVGLFIITGTLQKNLLLLMMLVKTSVSYITFNKEYPNYQKSIDTSMLTKRTVIGNFPCTPLIGTLCDPMNVT